MFVRRKRYVTLRVAKIVNFIDKKKINYFIFSLHNSQYIMHN